MQKFSPFLVNEASTCLKKAWLSANEGGAGLAKLWSTEAMEATRKALWEGQAVKGVTEDVIPPRPVSWMARAIKAKNPKLLIPPFTPVETSEAFESRTKNATTLTSLTLTHEQTGLTTRVHLTRTKPSNKSAKLKYTLLIPSTKSTAEAKAKYPKDKVFAWAASWVVAKEHYNVDKVALYYKGGDGYYVKKDVTKEVAEVDEGKVLAAAVGLAEALEGEEPEGVVEEKCSGCAYFSRCAEAPEDPSRASVFDIPKIRLKKKLELYASGIRYAADADPVAASLEASSSGAVITDIDGLKAFLETLAAGPTYYLDFETTSFYEPEGHLAGLPAYVPVPVQYSIHVDTRCNGLKKKGLPNNIEVPLMKHANGTSKQLPSGVAHFEFLDLAPEASNSRLAMAEGLIRDLGDSGPVVAWNAAFEKGVLNGLARAFPEHEEDLEAIVKRLVDLRDVFSKGLYTHKDFYKSSSLKAVVPVLCPHVRYDAQGRDGKQTVSDGQAASLVAYQASRRQLYHEAMTQVTPALLTYCRIDTAAMLTVASALAREVC